LPLAFIQGLSTGAAIAAVGCRNADMDKARGAVANSSGAGEWDALGGVLAGFMVHYLPAPRTSSYFVLAAIFVAHVVASSSCRNRCRHARARCRRFDPVQPARRHASAIWLWHLCSSQFGRSRVHGSLAHRSSGAALGSTPL